MVLPVHACWHWRGDPHHGAGYDAMALADVAGLRIGRHAFKRNRADASARHQRVRGGRVPAQESKDRMASRRHDRLRRGDSGRHLSRDQASCRAVYDGELLLRIVQATMAKCPA